MMYMLVGLDAALMMCLIVCNGYPFTLDLKCHRLCELARNARPLKWKQ